MVKKFLFVLGFVAASVILLAQGTGTPAQLRVVTDANNYLYSRSIAQTLPLSQPTQFNNTRLVTDVNGYLLITAVFTGGTSTLTYHPQGTLYWERPAVSTSAGSTTWVTSTVFNLKGGALATDGDRLSFNVNVLFGAATTDIKNLSCNIGYSAFSTATGVFTGGINFVLESSAANAGTMSWWVKSDLTRLSATTASTHWYSQWENTTTTQSAQYSTPSLTWANDNNILCAVGNTTGGNNQIITLEEVRVELQPR